MTAQEFVEKWPEAQRNVNTLCDVACLECGNRSYFRIAVERVARVTDDGLDCSEGETEWDMNSWCMCGACESEGDYKNFVVPGIDDYLAKRERAVTSPH